MCVSGDPSAKDLEKLFSLGWLSSQGSQSSSSWSPSGLKTKRKEKRKSSERKSLPNSPHTQKKDNLSKASETRDSKSSQLKEAAAMEARIQHISQETPFKKLPKPEVIQEPAVVKLPKHESRKGPRREAAEPELEARRKRDIEHEQEERRRKKGNDSTESFTSQGKNRFGSKHLEKTVSIRLVDIRNSDSDNYFIDEGIKRSPVSPDVTSNTKCNKASTVSDTAPSAKTNGWLRRASADSSHASNGPEAAQLRSWGKFRIPKRSEKPASITEQKQAELHKPLLRPLTNTPKPSYPRTRLRTGTENEDYTSDSKAGDGELEPCLKRCHSHQLRGDSSLSRRYVSDIIRRGVLAS